MILFLAANPRDTGRLALDREARSIHVELKRSGYRDRFEFVTRWAAEPLDLLRELRELRPTIVHFSGHGAVFEGANGRSQLVTPEAFAQTLDAAGSSVRLVVLNACYTASIAAALLVHVDCVVGMNGAVHDDATRSFAIGFYGGLGEYESVTAAFKQGRAAIQLDGLPDADRPQLQVRHGFDAAQLILAAVAPSVPVVAPCPYPGMRPFAADDAASFHGRETEIAELIGRLRAGQREIFVIGPSGSGKSSLVAAGVLPRLARGRSGLGSFVVRELRPGDQPFLRLCEALDAPPRQQLAVAERVAALVAHRAPGASVLVVVDQLEELFTQASADEHERFIDALRTLRTEPRCAVIFTLRADFSGALMESSLWPERPAQLARIDVGPLRGQALREAITVPARDVGVTVEPELIERLVADAASEPGILPLLQEALVQLWHTRADHSLTLAAYHALGDGIRSGLAVALAHRADATLQRFTAAQTDIARRILLRLTSFGEGRSDTRRQQPREQLCAAGEDPAEFAFVLQTMVEHRLLTVDEDVASEPLVDLAHEIMISAWPVLAGWIRSHRVDEQRRRQLEETAAQWVSRGRGANGLLDRIELADAEKWQRTESAVQLGNSTQVVELLAASRAAHARRRKAIALLVTIVTVLTATGTVMYVRNIAAARDRADAALDDARRERDRARLSEAAQLLENDPNGTKELLASLTLRSPQFALLTSRMQQLSAVKVIGVAGGVIEGPMRVPGSATVELVTREGGFLRLEPSSGQVEPLDHDLTGAVSYRAGQWLYARQTYGAGSVRIASPAQSNLFDVDLASVSRLVALSDAVYALDGAGDLHRLDGKTATVVDHGVRNIVGDGELRMVCKLAGELEITRKDVVVYRGTCPPAGSPFTMAAVHDDYATLTADHTLIASRNGRHVEIPTPFRGEYELALSTTGLIAISDYRSPGTTSFLRPENSALEAGPQQNAKPFCVAVDGNLAAWGYNDGTVIVLDTASGTVWPLRGQPGPVSAIVIDAANARVVTAGRRELRVWELKPPMGTTITALPCEIANIMPSPDGQQVALDCKDGNVRVWGRGTGSVTQVHSHAVFAYGVQWVKGMICSGGFVDGHIVCSNPDGTGLRTLDSGTNRIMALTANPDHDFLVFASGDGRVWRYDDRLQELYVHSQVDRVAISPDGRLLASCALDGTLAVYDLANHRLIAHVHDHVDAANQVAWVDGEVWTFGSDGAVKRWAVRDGAVVLQHSLDVRGPMTNVVMVRHTWASNAGERILAVGHGGDAVALRLDLGKAIDALDVSPDQRYVAAGINGEIVVIDLQRNAIATVTVGSPRPKSLRFLDTTTLAFSEVAALKVVDVDRLEYVPFQPSIGP